MVVVSDGKVYTTETEAQIAMRTIKVARPATLRFEASASVRVCDAKSLGHLSNRGFFF